MPGCLSQQHVLHSGLVLVQSLTQNMDAAMQTALQAMMQ